MTESEQVSQFADEVDKLVERFRIEYDMSYASVVGVLHMKTHFLCREAEEMGDDGFSD